MSNKNSMQTKLTKRKENDYENLQNKQQNLASRDLAQPFSHEGWLMPYRLRPHQCWAPVVG